MDKTKNIRALALAVIRDRQGRVLLDYSADRVSGHFFYRPIGGGIEFGEAAANTVVREFEEEIGRKIEVKNRIDVLENIFEHEGKPGHEVVIVFDAKFMNPQDEEFEALEIIENSRAVSKAVWVSLDEIKEKKLPLYPQGVFESLKRFGY